MEPSFVERLDSSYYNGDKKVEARRIAII